MLQLQTLQKFIDKLQGEHTTVFKMAEVFRQNIPLLTDELPIHQIEVSFVSHSGKKISQDILFCADDVPLQIDSSNLPADSFSYLCDSGDKGDVMIYIYPPKGTHWSQEEKNMLRLLAQIINVYSGKARLTDLMQKAALTDNLTGALNLNGLMHFGSIHEKNHTLSEYTGALIDIKNFKYINKEFGILQGDDILRGFCKEIDTLLDADEILARVGANSFVVFFKNHRVDSFIRKMMSLQITARPQGALLGIIGELGIPSDTPDATENTDTYTYLDTKEEHATYDISVRMGLYSIQAEDTTGVVLNNLTSALALSRDAANEDFVWFDRSILDQEINSQQISYLFDGALKNREFVVYYQPKVTLNDDTLCGCEALVRWFRNGKIVPPITFIPTLEEDGNICRLDFHVFRTVCSDIRKWLDEGLIPVKVSVNFSRLHLENEQFAEEILSIMKEYQIDSKYLEIELTETTEYEDYDRLNRFIDAMQDCQIAVSIDDFGTGYSSLSLLKNLKVDVIKLDQSFVHDINKEEDAHKEDRIVIKNIVSMINELQMTVIAEGVETPVQADFLRSVNCKMAQGYLYDRPIPRNEFEERLRGSRHYLFNTSST